MKRMWGLNQKKPNSRKRIIKWVLFAFFIYLILFPENVTHALYVVIHAVLESIASVIEEFLMHVFGLNKFYSQLIVAYCSFGLVIYLLFRLWKSWPKLAKKLTDYLKVRLLEIKNQIRMFWLQSTAIQKILVLTVTFISMKLMFILLM